MRTHIADIFKVTAAVVFLFAVGAAIVAFSGDVQQPVKSAEADIAMLSFAKKSQDQRFVDGLMRLGFEEPRSYDWNGNKVFFTHTYSKKTPIEVMRLVQDEMAYQGINKKAHGTPKSISDSLKLYQAGQGKEAAELLQGRMGQLDDLFSGGLVPDTIHPNYVKMIGATSKGNAKTAFEFAEEHVKSGKTIEELIGSMRIIEAERQEHEKETLVTAVWSDRDLDMMRFKGDVPTEGQAVETEIPTCAGCKNLMRFAGEGKEQGYKSNVFISQGAPMDAVRFYDRTLANRGWQRMESSKLIDELRAKGMIQTQGADFASYVRGDQFITLTVSREDSGSSFVHLLQSP